MDVPNNDSVCTFAIQTVVCGNITGNISDPITIDFCPTKSTLQTPTNILSPTENLGIQTSDTTEIIGMQNLDKDTAVYIISILSLAAALIATVVVFIPVLVVILKRSKPCKTTALFVQSNRAECTKYDEPIYENITDPLPFVSVIHTQDNVAYDHLKPSTDTCM